MTRLDARPAIRPDQPAPMQLALHGWAAVRAGKLLGFADIELVVAGLVLHGVTLFSGPEGPWCALPSRPLLDGERRQKIEVSGKPAYQPSAAWCNRTLSEEFSAGVIELIRQAHPGALADVGPEPVVGQSLGRPYNRPGQNQRQAAASRAANRFLSPHRGSR